MANIVFPQPALYHIPQKEVDSANILLSFSNIISVTFFFCVCLSSFLLS